MLFADQLAIGSWRTHLAYNNSEVIAQARDKVYAISEGALFSVGKYDESVEIFSKISGLNDNNIQQIAYSKDNNTLVIAYANSNIDLITDNGIFNITDIKRKNIIGSKTINDIYFINNYVYFSCDFGIVVLNLTKQEIVDTYIIGDEGNTTPILSFTELNGQFYATTENNILTASSTGVNLANFENWTKLTTIPTSSTNTKTITYGSSLFLLQQDSVVYEYTSGNFVNKFSQVANICSKNNYLFVIRACQVDYYYNGNSSPQTISACDIKMAEYDFDNHIVWMAANYAGVAKWYKSDNSLNVYRPSGPATNTAWRIKYSNGKMIAIPGERWAVEENKPGHVMMFENGNWTNITQATISAQTNLLTKDFVDVAIDPSDNSHFFVASYGVGLYEFRNNQFFKLYNADNSGVESIYPTQKPQYSYYYYHRIDGLCFDKSSNLFFLNMGTSSTVKYLTPDTDGNGPLESEVKQIPYAAIKPVGTAQDILISNQNSNQKWVLIPRINSSSTGIFTFNDNGTLDNTNDDVSKLYTYFYDQDGNKFQPSNFRCIAQDQNNTLWVGSTSGPFVLNNQSKAFEDGYTCSRIKIPRNDGTNLADYLLDEIQVNAIAIDGANRKWIGTESSGVFLVSESGLETIEHFTSENSPLLSDNIISIGINEKTGEVFFGTGNGIISYQSDAVEGNETFTSVHVFPNPVRETYSGVISITGLMTDSRVKITDINGNLIYDTISNGGIATWDGNRYNGRRVATGIYLVMCFSSDGKQYATTKVLIINK